MFFGNTFAFVLKNPTSSQILIGQSIVPQLEETIVSDLQPAAELAEKSAKPYPNDSPEYRSARKALLTEEILLRRHIERVAQQRRALPLGGDPTPLWTILDLTPEGRGNDWYPKLEYAG